MTNDHGRRRKVLLVVVSAIFGAVMAGLVTAGPPASSEPPVTLPAPPAVVEQPVEQRRRASSAIYCVLAPLLLVLTLWLTSRERWVLAEITASAAILVLVIALRGPVWRRGRWTSAALVVLAVLAVSFNQLLILTRINRSVSDVGGLLLQSALFIVFVGVLAWLVASWGMAVLAEVGALLLIALLLGFVSFSGISYFTAPLSAPEADGTAMVVFAADPAAEVNVVVTYFPVESAGTTVMSLQVSIDSTDHRWGIVLTGRLQFKSGDASGTAGMALTDSSDGYQVLTGTQGTGNFYNGTVFGSFQRSSASRSIVSLPPIFSDPLALAAIDVRSAAGFAAGTPKSLTLSVDYGTLGPLKTVTQATPPLVVPNQLAWRAQDKLSPITFATFDQGDDDRARNALFVVAILLGAAVACLVAALQVLLKAVHRPT